MVMQHGGCAIYVKETLDLETVTFNATSMEGQFEYSCSVSRSLRLLAICMYRTLKGDIELFLKFLTNLKIEVDSAFQRFKIAICGDFNIDLLKKNNSADKFLDTLHTFNVQQTIFSPTREIFISQTLLDNIFTRDCETILEDVIISSLSEHHG